MSNSPDSANSINPAHEETFDLDSLSFADNAPYAAGPGRRVEKTRALLAYLLFGLLAGELVILLILLAFKIVTVQGFSEIGGVVISPVVGLLGAATGYYYGRGDR